MSEFAFVGKLPASKSILNRLLLVQSYFPALEVRGENQCEDVRKMQACVAALNWGQALDAGAAGTVLRFMALRLSREKGRHRIQGERRLFERPQEELLRILKQVGVEARLYPDALEIESDGWRLQGDTLLVPFQRSSQFATSVLLNAWSLPFDLYVSLGGTKVSEGYWRMSVRLAQKLGMKMDFWDSDFRIPRGQVVSASTAEAEIDVSSAFALAAVAAVSGRSSFHEFPFEGLQPDVGFVSVLASMGVPVRQQGSTLNIEKARTLNGVAVNLKTMPDLFPVLAALCALAEGESELYGAPHLIHKESDRLQHMADFLQQLGRRIELKSDGLKVLGPRVHAETSKTVEFDPRGDHRLAFAAAVLMAAGFDIRLRHPEVVEKSFPEFWRILGWDLKSPS